MKYSRLALIAGAGGGLGKAMTNILAKNDEYARIIAVDCRRQSLEALKHPRVICIEADVARPTGLRRVKRLVERQTEAQLALCISCVGRYNKGPVAQCSPEEAIRVIEANFLGPVLLASQMLPLMAKAPKAHFLFIVSNAINTQKGGEVLYGSAKVGLASFAARLRKEAREAGITVSVVNPGGMDTEFFQQAGVEIDTSRFMRPEDVAKYLLRQILEPDVIAFTDLVIQPSSV